MTLSTILFLLASNAGAVGRGQLVLTLYGPTTGADVVARALADGEEAAILPPVADG